MYEPIEACATDFNEFQKMLADPSSTERIETIRAALEATAANISKETGSNEMERNQLAQLYRGMLAASRIVAHLQEKRGAA
ncbi:type III secretion protein [Trinickia sp. LjRoot230]|uniref:type III secretion protein n=1 Tax=Trinickia sp. LjRoot230 TaxID=3342288 RepID=UPI003ECDCA2D